MTSATVPAPAETKASIWEDFLDIFYAPSQVFARRIEGKFGLALLILVILNAVLVYASMQVLEPVFTAEVERSLAMGGTEIPAEQMGAARSFGSIMLMVSLIIGVPIIVMLSGLVLWLVGKLFDSTQTLSQGLMVSTYANVPRLLGSLLLTVQGFLITFSTADRLYDATFSLARFTPEGTSELVRAMLFRFEVFTIWATILLGIGLHITGKVPKGKAMTAAFIVWVLGSLPAVLGALRGG